MTFGTISPAHPVIAPSALQLKLAQAEVEARATAHVPPPAAATPPATVNPAALLDTVA